ncbi:ent-kaurene oxidase [Colletotrichum higginsianum IMI 349063]|uniref:Ent-kaurene oxidase n=2 Tax=Colletotrichum higginsianum (strain IMI 349063) TaxID=759273 RepID=A0A1B7YRH9_COLHI|nr:ent-kaurene oxidase [Colletotrichum higginsianum IMI 349063]OBR14659.1 ent-kaurene oxidase [Colletotrichum higginsianum IMI 349063]
MHRPIVALALGLAATFLPYAAAAAAPSDSDWQALHDAVGGRLFTAEPLARPCFSMFNGQAVKPDENRCAVVAGDYRNGSIGTDSYASFVHTYNEACASNVTDQCLPPTGDFTAGSVSGQCNQGTLSERYITVAGAKDVQAALGFARRTGVTLSVKATGHDYAGRSSRKGSLALWTRKLDSLDYAPSFTPLGSSAPPVQALTIGAGVNLGEVYAFADRHNVTFVGGSSGTVTAAGGYTLFGGHGVLTPLYGMGADRVLEFRIVTPDGEFRTANEATNPDLFWALRGGGGAAFGVVLDATFKVEPAMPLTLSLMRFDATATNTGPFLSLLMNRSAAWAEEGWGGPMDASTLALLTPTLDLDVANRSMEPVAAYVTAQGGTVVLERHPSFYSFYTKYVAASSSTGAGTATFATFRVLPKRLHRSEEGRAAVASTFQAMMAAGLKPYVFQTAPSSYAHTPGSNAVHPAWRDSYWLVGTSLSWESNGAGLEERVRAAALLQEVSGNLTALAPEGSMYPNEADPWTEDWRREFWGEENYEKLLQIKRKYDPDGLLSCWKCVGFEDKEMETDPAYRCMGAFQRTST